MLLLNLIFVGNNPRAEEKKKNVYRQFEISNEAKLLNLPHRKKDFNSNFECYMV